MVVLRPRNGSQTRWYLLLCYTRAPTWPVVPKPPSNLGGSSMSPRNLLLWLAAGTLIFASSAGAEEPLKVAGKNTCMVGEQHAFPIEGQPDHVIVVVTFTCNASASGQSSMFDGGQIAGVETD